VKPTVLVSWSGGIDSTSCLWQLLRDGEKVLAHHVVLKTPEKRWRMESKAIAAQREWFRKQGYGFVYHETGYDYGTVRRFTRDINITAFIAGHILIGYPGVMQAVVSSSADDERRLGRNPGTQSRRRMLTELMAGCWTAKERDGQTVLVPTKRRLEWLTPNIAKPKAQVMAEMPPDLLALCWYCRRPQGTRPCGKCRTCREVESARRRMSRAAG